MRYLYTITDKTAVNRNMPATELIASETRLTRDELQLFALCLKDARDNAEKRGGYYTVRDVIQDAMCAFSTTGHMLEFTYNPAITGSLTF